MRIPDEHLPPELRLKREALWRDRLAAGAVMFGMLVVTILVVVAKTAPSSIASGDVEVAHQRDPEPSPPDPPVQAREPTPAERLRVPRQLRSAFLDDGENFIVNVEGDAADLLVVEGHTLSDVWVHRFKHSPLAHALAAKGFQKIRFEKPGHCKWVLHQDGTGGFDGLTD